MKKRHILLAVLLCLAFALGACSPPADGAGTPPAADSSAAQEVPANGEPKVGGTLNVGLTGDPYSVASWLSNDMNATLITNLAFPRMMEVDEAGAKYPYILESFLLSDDAMQCTVTLREGLSWHDGEPLTTEDLAFTAQYVVDKSLTFCADMYKAVERTEIVDERTLIYHMKYPSVNFLSQAGYWVQIMPEHIYRDVEDPNTFDHPVIGYGPYRFVDHVKGEYYSFERVENWPLANDGKGAYIQNIIFRIYPDVNAMILAMKNGEIDVTGSSIPPVAQKQLEGDEFQVLSVPSLGYGYLAFSYKNPILADNTVRKAIAMTIDTGALVNIALQGGAIEMRTPISPVYENMVQAGITFPDFDIDAANKLLDDAGYTDSDGDGIREHNGTPMKLVLNHRTTTAGGDSIANILKDNCALAGIALEIQPLESATYTDKIVKNYDFDLCFLEWGVIDDPDTQMGLVYKSDSALNFMQYKNEAMDKLMTDVVSEIDYEKRVAMMEEFQQLFVEELPTVNCWVRISSYGASNRFAGWGVLPGLHGIMNTREIVQVYEK